jgi:hypothetical protein
VSGESFRVDPQSIRTSGQDISTAADQLSQQVAAFQAGIAGFGEPWGTDDLGSLIGMTYQAIAEMAMECFQDNITDLAAYGEDVGTMADTYESADQGVDEGIRTITDQLG